MQLCRPMYDSLYSHVNIGPEKVDSDTSFVNYLISICVPRVFNLCKTIYIQFKCLKSAESLASHHRMSE